MAMRECHCGRHFLDAGSTRRLCHQCRDTARRARLCDPYRSVTFLLDRRGVVQHVHHEGQYVKGDLAYEEMRRTIERLLMDQERFDELFERIEKETSTEPEWAELELLTKAQQQVALVQMDAADAEVVRPPK
jgi:hypothetical protein